MTSILVTGATGFVGRHLIRLLEDTDLEVHAVSGHPTDGHPRTLTHTADLLDPDAASALLRRVRPTHVIHLAWIAVPGQYWTSLENVRWFNAGLALARAFWESGGKRFVTVGTCAQYDWSYTACKEFATPTIPSTLYGKCKLALETALDCLAVEGRGTTASARLFFPYGPYERPERLVPSVIRSLSRGEPAICSVGTQQRDFVYIEDVAGALLSLLKSDVVGPVNIGSGRAITVREVATIIGEKMGRPELLRFEKPLPASEPQTLVADIHRLSVEVGWRPRVDLERGLEKTIEWWNTRAQLSR